MFAAIAHALPHLGCWASGGGGGAEPTARGTLTAAAAAVVLDAALVAMPPDLQRARAREELCSEAGQQCSASRRAIARCLFEFVSLRSPQASGSPGVLASAAWGPACVDGPSSGGVLHCAIRTHLQAPSTPLALLRLCTGGHTQRAAGGFSGTRVFGKMQALGARMSLTRPCAQPLRANRQCSRLASGSSRPQVAARVFGGKGDPEKEVSVHGRAVAGVPSLAADVPAAAAAACCQCRTVPLPGPRASAQRCFAA